jgi:hypothetical protein
MTRNDQTRKLRRMIRLRIHCSEVSKGFRSDWLRTLEDRLDKAISLGTFGSAERRSDSEKANAIRNIADDIDFAAMEAQRADLFLFGRR